MKPLRILVAEDEYLVLMGLKTDLINLGHKVIGEALNGKEAFDLAVKIKPDLIIMDINMPILDGIEAIKKINKVCMIPSIIITGYNDKELIDRANEAGVFGYMVKPVDTKEIEPAINIALARFEEFQSLKSELENTKEALRARKYIEQAKGILMKKLQLDEPEAMKMLQKKSNDSNKKLIEISKNVINKEKCR